MTGKHTGKRLRWARKAKGFQLKELATAFNVKANTIQVWQVRGIPEDKIMSISLFFGVEDWVFRDKKISEIDFTNIILLPSFQDYYKQSGKTKDSRPILLCASLGPSNNRARAKDSFYCNGGTLFIITHVSGAKGVSAVQLFFAKHELRRLRSLERASRPPSPRLFVITKESTKPSDKFIQQDIINQVEKGHYSLSVDSRYEINVDVYVYDFNFRK